MAGPPIRTDNWANGANNVAKPERMPEGFVRGLVNFDPEQGGQLDLRAGYEKIIDGESVRFAIGMDSQVIYADGLELAVYSVETDGKASVGALTSEGAMAGTVFNSQAYLCTATDSLRTDGVAVKPWAIPAPGCSVEVIPGDMPEGLYKVALVALGSDGEESGADPISLQVNAGEALRVTSSDPRTLRLYVSTANGSTLYSQGLLIGGSMAITKVDDDSERLTTAGLVPLPACTSLVTYHGVIVGICGKTVVFSSPMHPHLFDPVSGFYQYSKEPSVIIPTDGGLFVVADKTYFITGLESAEPFQSKKLDIGAVSGSAVELPDGRVAWFTKYGMAIGSADGSVLLPNRESYAPDIAASGASGVVEHNGNPMVITTMRGRTQEHNLATGDFADLEI